MSDFARRRRAYAAGVALLVFILLGGCSPSRAQQTASAGNDQQANGRLRSLRLLELRPPVLSSTGPAQAEVPLRARLAKIGVEAGRPFAVDKLTPEQKTPLESGIKSGLEKIPRTGEG